MLNYDSKLVGLCYRMPAEGREERVVKAVNKWTVLFLTSAALTILLFPLLLGAGFPSPSLCATGGYEYWNKHFASFLRECAPLFTAPYGHPYGFQLIVDRLYMWGVPWVTSLLVAVSCAFLGALLLITAPQILRPRLDTTDVAGSTQQAKTIRKSRISQR
jgi:hypothetical protein